MALKFYVVFTIFIVCVNSFEFGFDDDFFDDSETTEKRSLGNGGVSASDDNTIFVSESTSRLEDGREMITKESVKWLKNPKTGKWSKKKTERHFMRMQNGTVFEVDEDGSGVEGKSEGELTKIECLNEDDCKDDQFCDKLSYACRDCLKLNETCHSHTQCCKGSLCRDGKCDKIVGKENDPCDSDKDCKANHCCAYDKGHEVCKPYLKQGEVCGEHQLSGFPSFFASRFVEEGKKTRCPCLKGLECRKKYSFFLYNNQVCVKQKSEGKKKKRKSKKAKKVKKVDEKENEINEMEKYDEDMDFLPEDAPMEADEMFDNAIHEADDDNDEDEEHEDFKKRSLPDGDEKEDDFNESFFESIPKLIKGFVRGILDNFE